MDHNSLVYFYRLMDPVFLFYFASINVVYLILLILGTIENYFRFKEITHEDVTSILSSNSLPEITLLVCAYNESLHMKPLIDNLHRLSYRYIKVVIVNDGSTDNTMQVLKDNLDLVLVPKYFTEKLPTMTIINVYRSKKYPEFTVVDKEHGTKYDTLNVGLNVIQTPFYISVDADTYVDDEGLNALIRPILRYPDTIAVGATIRIRNNCSLNFNTMSTEHFPTNIVEGMQALEYLRAFIMRQGWNYLGGNYVLSGAFTVFATDKVIKARGYAPTIGNDMEIVLRLNRLMKATHTPFRMVSLADTGAWTEGPGTLKVLDRQRKGWQIGLMESMWYNKCMFMNPKYGAYGLFVYPFVVYGEVLEPVIEILGIIYIIIGMIFGIVNPFFVVLFLILTWGMVLIFTLHSLLIEELTYSKYTSVKGLVKFLGYTLIENLWYRQLNIWWRLKGIYSFFKDFKNIQRHSRILNEKMREVINNGEMK